MALSTKEKLGWRRDRHEGVLQRLYIEVGWGYT